MIFVSLWPSCQHCQVQVSQLFHCFQQQQSPNTWSTYLCFVNFCGQNKKMSILATFWTAAQSKCIFNYLVIKIPEICTKIIQYKCTTIGITIANTISANVAYAQCLTISGFLLRLQLHAMWCGIKTTAKTPSAPPTPQLAHTHTHTHVCQQYVVINKQCGEVSGAKAFLQWAK